MRNIPFAIVLLALVQLFSLPLLGQKSAYQIEMKAGNFTPPDSINSKSIASLNASVKKQKAAAIVQFYELPSTAQKTTLDRAGIVLLNYIGGHAYVVSVNKAVNTAQLKAAGVRSVNLLLPEQKIQPSLLPFAAQALSVQASVFSFASLADVIQQLNERGFTARPLYEGYPVLQIDMPAGRLKELASMEFIEFIEPLPPAPVELNDKTEATTRANVLQSPDYGLTGEGVVMQINEIGNYPQGHIDFIDRSITGSTQPGSNYHSTHVHGIATGAGIINELYKGYAPKARFFSSGPFITQMGTNVQNYGVTLSNNSYGAGNGCSNYTLNSIVSIIVDKYAIDFPSLINVFSAGNWGDAQCPLYPLGYNTIDASTQVNKSVLTVGSTNTDGSLTTSSSKGPVKGGRLKPEIVTPGVQVWSTVPDNAYFTNSGTSMASPAATGGLALLYQRYMQTHNGAKPANALMKPLLCNTATDMGTIGPDYAYGFGLMNLNRAIQALDAQYYFTDSVTNQQSKTKTITVPAGIAQLKLMLYWNDRPPSPLITKPIINDLDLKLTAPGSFTVLPYVLDTVPSRVANAATRGADHINNIEQVLIDRPAPGIYTIEVNGFEVGEGTQQNYYVVYDLVPDAVQMTFPSSGQSLAPGETIRVQWDSWGLPSSGYQLEFSTNNGQSWQMVDAGIAPGSTAFVWTVPSIVTSDALFRVTRNADQKTSVSGRFKIMGIPSMALSASQCPGSIAIEWSAVAGATDYELMQYRSGEMVSVGTTSQTNYLLGNLSEDSVYWVSVRPRYNGQPGRRAVAVSRRPNTGDCAAPQHDGDLKMEALAGPLFGRMHTSTQLGTESIQVKVRNLDNVAASGFTIGYAVNGGPWVTQTIAGTLAANSSGVFTIGTGYDFSQVADYQLKLMVHAIADPNPANDTITAIVRQVANDPISLNSASITDVENAPVQDCLVSSNALKGLDRFDYFKSSATEILRVGSHFSQNPTKGLELVYASPSNAVPDLHSLTATYNLSQFDTAQHSVALDFKFVHAVSNPSFDSLLIRGSDTESWVLMENLYNGTITLRELQGIAIADSLRAHHQNFSSSFQIKWAPSATYSSLVVDDIKLYNSTHDLALTIDSLLSNNCALSATTQIRVTVQNRGLAATTNVVVKYKADNGAVVSETLASVPAHASIAYSFMQTANLSAIGNHVIEAWVEFAPDDYTENNVQVFRLQNLPYIKSFPHVEDLEAGNGGWYTEGTRSSWEWGTPVSPRINGAASGTHAWKTNLDGNHNDNEQSYLYSGCYDLSGLTKPMISISAALNIDSCGSPLACDFMNFQYSINGKDWRALVPKPVHNWPLQIVSTWYNRWHVMSQRLPDTLKKVQFRFMFRSDGFNNYEGVGLDDLHIYDSTALIYEGASNEVEAAVSGGQQWIEFSKDGKLLAAVQPGGQNLGTVKLKSFLANTGVRNFHGQYYANRNFVWNSTNPPADSVLFRIYFTDREADSLLLSRLCTSCTRPANVYRFGISTYHGNEAVEMDSSILNNRKGQWNFIPSSRVRMVPFANGYYAEFKIKDAAELRLSNGGLDGLSDLPVRVQNFTAAIDAAQTNALIEWQTAAEINIHHFDVEVAKGNQAWQHEQFEKIGEVASRGRSNAPQAYSLTDNSSGKYGVRYYRIRAVDSYGNYTLTDAIPVLFTEELNWLVYPNPSKGKFNLVYQSAAGDVLQLKLYNANGEQVKTLQLTANGFIQKTEIDLAFFSVGVYYLRVSGGQQAHLVRLVKQ